MSDAPRCPYCLDDLLPDEQETVRCARCRTPHHHVCFEEHGGCVAFGCQGEREVPSGMSIFTRQVIHIEQQRQTSSPFGPFTLVHRPLSRVPERRPIYRCPQAYVRVRLESREVREGQVLAGRAVVYTPVALAYRRLELLLHRSVEQPKRIARVPLVPSVGLMASRRLEPGTHPFALELHAPSFTPPVDPFLVEGILVKGPLSELRSSQLPVYLLQRPEAPPRIVLPPIRVEPRVAEPREPRAPWDEAQPPRPRDPAPPRQAPSSPPVDPDAWHELEVQTAGSLYDSSVDTGRSLGARFCLTPGQPNGALQLDAPSRPSGREFPVQVHGGGPLSTLSLAIHYTLIRPGGGEVEAPGFPAVEEIRLLGSTGPLVPTRYGADTGLQLLVRVPPERLAALAAAQDGGARNAALRLRLALDAIDPAGRVVPATSRSVTFVSARTE